jgi:site-specific DNA recombinase
MNPAANGSFSKVVRCAVYARKSTEEGLDRQFTSLDAQRESAEAYIASQGWLCLPDHYDDGGFSGGNMERPALARLLADIRAGKIDCVVIYKVDRLSRSLLDFAKMMEIFDQLLVSFISVSQHLYTATSMGRLVLNILLSFAQFEREIISERTRDKIAATRRKGKWTGGVPPLGYDLDPREAKLKLNAREAVRVRAIFELYLQHRTLAVTLREIDRRCWRSKRWHNRQGELRGGRKFTQSTLRRLLTNACYTGMVRRDNELHRGEQPAIVSPEDWQHVQDLLQDSGSSRPISTNRSGALLQGLLRCTPCGRAMTPVSSVHGGKRYRYYLCCGAHRQGRQNCPSGSIPALAVENLVLEQIHNYPHESVAAWPDLRMAVPAEQRRWLRRLIDRVDYDGAQKKVSIAFRQSAVEAATPATEE